MNILRGVWHLLRGGEGDGDLPLATGSSFLLHTLLLQKGFPTSALFPCSQTQRREGWERGRLSAYPLEMRKGQQPTIIKRIRAQVLLTCNHTMTMER